ncbi:MAG: glycosyltransferase N-terminal domain-containing protein [Elusimicrobiota bacterium]|jgi:3-deoxy-D-manno-octulosonic-acid transferase
MLRAIAPYLGYLYVTLVGWTTRWRVTGGERRESLRRSGRRFIYAFWHQRQVFLTCSHRGDPARVLVSRSRDGEIVARLMGLSGIGTVRGSSSRGAAAALKEMAGLVAEGSDLGITPDGPKGPAREVKPGVLFLAQKLGIPILPIASSLTHRLVLRRSWDRFHVPLPFGRAIIRYGTPIEVAPGDDLTAKAAELKSALDLVTAEADAEAFSEPGIVDAFVARCVAVLSTLLAPVVAAGFGLRMLASPRRRLMLSLPEEWRERSGRPEVRALSAAPERPVVWVHAASVGEVAAAQLLIERLQGRKAAPSVVVTCNTAAGRARALKVPGLLAAWLAPLDSLPTVGRFLDAVRPYALVLIETELWPGMLESAFRRGLRVGLANGRLSPRSFTGYRLFRPLVGPFLRRLDRVAVQTSADAERFVSLGARPASVAVCGNMKYDLVAPSSGREAVQEALGRLGWEGASLVVAGSTHPGEEELLVAAFRQARRRHPDLRMVLAPRHLERSGDASVMLTAAGVSHAVWSRLHSAGGLGGYECLLLDAMGVLPAWYAFASVAFVGGTLVPVGGHNLLEPALHSKAPVFGPHTFHTEQSAAALVKSGGGLRVAGPEDLSPAFERLLSDPEWARSAGQKARQTLAGLQGGIERTLAHLGPCLAP